MYGLVTVEYWLSPLTQLQHSTSRDVTAFPIRFPSKMSVLTAEQRALFATADTTHSAVGGTTNSSAPPVGFVKRRKNKGVKPNVGAPGSEMDGGDDNGSEEEGPNTARLEEEARIAMSMGVKTEMDVGATVAGSLVGLGRSGHSTTSPDRTYGANGPARTVTLPSYKAMVASILQEFYLEQDYDEIRRCYAELAAPFFGYEFVRRSLMTAMEKTDKEREMASRMLSMCVPVQSGRSAPSMGHR